MFSVCICHSYSMSHVLSYNISVDVFVTWILALQPLMALVRSWCFTKYLVWARQSACCRCLGKGKQPNLVNIVFSLISLPCVIKPHCLFTVLYNCKHQFIAMTVSVTENRFLYPCKLSWRCTFWSLYNISIYWLAGWLAGWFSGWSMSQRLWSKRQFLMDWNETWHSGTW